MSFLVGDKNDWIILSILPQEEMDRYRSFETWQQGDWETLGVALRESKAMVKILDDEKSHYAPAAKLLLNAASYREKNGHLDNLVRESRCFINEVANILQGTDSRFKVWWAGFSLMRIEFGIISQSGEPESYTLGLQLVYNSFLDLMHVVVSNTPGVVLKYWRTPGGARFAWLLEQGEGVRKLVGKL